MANLTATTRERLRIGVQGVVQGVGFRPFVYREAVRLHLSGRVYNTGHGVIIEVEGAPSDLATFQRTLVEQAPPLAKIDSLAAEVIPVLGDTGFEITRSQQGVVRATLIAPDATVCVDCLAELFEPTDRRYRYPLINCTNCGPRFTIVEDVPYDRANTTMRAFPMCADCRAEYDDPLSRRFHAQPNACPACGPQIRLTCAEGYRVEAADPITEAAFALGQGAILAIKGLGGYHLACDASNPEAVGRLRERKHREARPFALMVPDLDTARCLCAVSEDEARLLESARRPIVLLEKAEKCPVAEGVAPGLTTLGLMLPYTPLHYLLLNDFAARKGSGQVTALVMTSGNRSDEPIAYRDDDARDRLELIADGILSHDRDIHTRCDDSVARVAAGGQQIFRRSRGYAPDPISLSYDTPMPILACGGHLKNTFALCKGRQVFVSHHIGDLENLETLESYREGIEHYQRLFDIYPRAVAYDLHPGYLATKYALDLDMEHRVGIQHHHAHIASVIAEHGLEGPVIGVAADGTGYGTDGAVWGCEIMVADLGGFQRYAHLKYVPLPGGEQAVRQPWRMAAAYLADAFGDAFLQLDIPFVHQLDKARWRPLAQMITKSINSPPASSLGRLFDAVGALLGGPQEARYEGQTAIELEALAVQAPKQTDLYPFDLVPGTPDILDVDTLIQALVEDIRKGIPISNIAARFHNTVAEMLLTACNQVRESTGLGVVALSGGVFQNRLLLERLVTRLEESRFEVYINRRVPTNDGGLSFGQATIAAWQLSTR